MALPKEAAILLAAYRENPYLYARQVLGVEWWSRQQQIAQALLKHKKVFVQASHAVGKSFVAASLTNWFFDCHNPSVCITTAPNQQQVEDVLWKEIRVQRKGRPGLAPKAPRMETAENHFAVGMTARDSNAFQGRHEDSIFGIFDEATGIEGGFYDGMEGMMTNANDQAYWLAICNPTDTSTRAYMEVCSGDWFVMDVAAIDHPNIAAALEGRPLPYPRAVGIKYIDSMVRRFCTEIEPEDRRAGDIEWRPGSGRWFRPGPMMESRVLGRWPTQGSMSVWSDAIWRLAAREYGCGAEPIPESEWREFPLEIGCDVAWSGADFTTIVARRGPKVLHWETHNGWLAGQIAGGIKKVIQALVQPGEDPHSVLVKIDHDATGASVREHCDGWNFVSQSGAAKPFSEDEYPNRRSEAWFATAEMADLGRIDLSLLPDDAKKLLRAQAMGPEWSLDPLGRRVVEPKDKTRKRLRRSPDDMDAFNLAFAPAAQVVWSWGGRLGSGKGSSIIHNGGTRRTMPIVIAGKPKEDAADIWTPDSGPRRKRRRLFG